MRLTWIAATAVSTLALAACAGGGEMADGGSARSAAASGTPAAATAPTTAATYVAEAARSDMYEIQSSQLALTRASSPRVKAFAQQMVTDHAATTAALKSALANANSPSNPPATLDARRQDMLAQLRSASGADFDRLYLQQQLMAHQEALALHQGYAQNGDLTSLKAFAAQVTPKIQQHLSMVQGMATA